MYKRSLKFTSATSANKSKSLRATFQPATFTAPISSIFELLCCIILMCDKMTWLRKVWEYDIILHNPRMKLILHNISGLTKWLRWWSQIDYFFVTLLFLCLCTSFISSSPSCFLFWKLQNMYTFRQFIDWKSIDDFKNVESAVIGTDFHGRLQWDQINIIEFLKFHQITLKEYL